LALAWYAAIVLFYFFLLSYPRLQVVLVAAAALTTALVFEVTVALGHMHRFHWSTWETVCLGAISHVVALKVLRLFYREEVPKPRLPPFG